MPNKDFLRGVFLTAMMGVAVGGGMWLQSERTSRSSAPAQAVEVETGTPADAQRKRQHELDLAMLRATTHPSPYLTYAPATEDEAIARIGALLAKGARLDGGEYNPPLYEVLGGRSDRPLKLAKFLIDRGADLNALSHDFPEPPLMGLIETITFNGNKPMTAEDAQMLRLVLDAGANPNGRSFEGRTPLHAVALNAMTGEGGSIPYAGKFAALADILKSYGANPLLKDDNGMTPLEVIRAEAPENSQAIQYLENWERQVTQKTAAPAFPRPQG